MSQSGVRSIVADRVIGSGGPGWRRGAYWQFM